MSIDTTCVQGGYRPGNGEPRQVPIIQSTTFKYDTSEQMGRLFDLEETGYFYTRLQNPTNDAVAAKIAELEGGTAGMLTSSGQAANFFALFNICEAGSHIVASSAIYGGPPAPTKSSRRPSAPTRAPSLVRRSPTPPWPFSTSSASPRRRTRTTCRSSWTTRSPRR